MNYTLSKGLVVRREWFGCLCFQTYSGRFWQLNDDAFEILRHLKKAMTIEELRKTLHNSNLDISISALSEFLEQYRVQGLVEKRKEVSEVFVFNEKQNFFRSDCLSAPSSVTIYITDYCPKSCRHCATVAHSKIDRTEELSLSEWKKVLVKLRAAGVLMLVFSGGEPLAIPETEPLLKMANDMQFGLSLLSDYDGITDDQAVNLASLPRLLNVQTSLDGASAKSHDFIRGSGSFERTLQRIKLFSSAGINCTVSVSVHKKNIGELQEIADIVYEQGASYIYLNAVAPYGRAQKTMGDLILDDDELKQMAQMCLRWTAGDKIKLRNPFWEENLHHLGDTSFHPFANTLNAMSLGIYNFTINSRGRCYLDAKQRAEDFLFLGDIRNDDLLSMWNDSRLDELRKVNASQQFTFADQSQLEAVLASV